MHDWRDAHFTLRKQFNVDFTSTRKPRNIDFTIKNTNMLISGQQVTSMMLYFLTFRKQSKVDFMRMHDHRDAHLTFDRAKRSQISQG